MNTDLFNYLYQKKMQTFLPYADFKKSLQSLDTKRLGKQRLETYQIIKTLENPNQKGWKNHPATVMWTNHTQALKLFLNINIEVWVGRGYKNTMDKLPIDDNITYPWWFGNTEFHRAMRSRLIEKNPNHYIPIFGTSDQNFNNGKYLWPDNMSKTFKII